MRMSDKYVCYDAFYEYFVSLPMTKSVVKHVNIGYTNMDWVRIPDALTNLKVNGHSPVLYTELYVLFNPTMRWPK